MKHEINSKESKNYLHSTSVFVVEFCGCERHT